MTLKQFIDGDSTFSYFLNSPIDDHLFNHQVHIKLKVLQLAIGQWIERQFHI